MKKYSVRECIEGTVRFQFYRGEKLFYRCENGFCFEVPISDTGDAVFKESDKGIYFMRWIRRAIDLLSETEAHA